MAFLAPPTLHKVAAVLYGIVTTGHVIYGFQNVYPALERTPTDKPGAKGGRTGATLCWNLAATTLLALAAMHWKWSRNGASGSREESLAMLGLTAHCLWNGVQYLRIGEAAGPLLILTAGTGLTAVVADLRA